MFDSHCHLKDTEPRSGIFRLCCSAVPSDWDKLAEAASADNSLIPCFGIHPWYPEYNSEDIIKRLEKHLSGMPSCIGEAGLDRCRPYDGQEELLVRQLKLAREMKIPAVLHCVRAYGRLLDLLNEFKPPLFLIHSYSGSPEITESFIRLGGYFSFGPALASEKNVRARRALAGVPADRLMIESEGGSLDSAYAAAAVLLGKTEEYLIGLVSDNASEFLRVLNPAPKIL